MNLRFLPHSIGGRCLHFLYLSAILVTGLNAFAGGTLRTQSCTEEMERGKVAQEPNKSESARNRAGVIWYRITDIDAKSLREDKARLENVASGHDQFGIPAGNLHTVKKANVSVQAEKREFLKAMKKAIAQIATHARPELFLIISSHGSMEGISRSFEGDGHLEYKELAAMLLNSVQTFPNLAERLHLHMCLQTCHSMSFYHYIAKSPLKIHLATAADYGRSARLDSSQDLQKANRIAYTVLGRTPGVNDLNRFRNVIYPGITSGRGQSNFGEREKFSAEELLALLPLLDEYDAVKNVLSEFVRQAWPNSLKWLTEEGIVSSQPLVRAASLFHVQLREPKTAAHRRTFEQWQTAFATLPEEQQLDIFDNRDRIFSNYPHADLLKILPSLMQKGRPQLNMVILEELNQHGTLTLADLVKVDRMSGLLGGRNGLAEQLLLKFGEDKDEIIVAMLSRNLESLTDGIERWGAARVTRALSPAAVWNLERHADFMNVEFLKDLKALGSESKSWSDFAKAHFSHLRNLIDSSESVQKNWTDVFEVYGRQDIINAKAEAGLREILEDWEADDEVHYSEVLAELPENIWSEKIYRQLQERFTDGGPPKVKALLRRMAAKFGR